MEPCDIGWSMSLRGIEKFINLCGIIDKRIISLLKINSIVLQKQRSKTLTVHNISVIHATTSEEDPWEPLICSWLGGVCQRLSPYRDRLFLCSVNMLFSYSLCNHISECPRKVIASFVSECFPRPIGKSN